MIEEIKEKYRELAAKKRAELESALEDGQVADPVSIAISIAVSVAISAASYVLSAALAPKPPKRSLGALQGSLQLQNSEQGIMIPEIYGAGPTASIVAGASPTYQNLTNTTSGANGSITKTSGANNAYNAGASHNVAVVAGQDAFIRVIRGSGFAAAGFFTTASPTGSGEQTTGMIFGVAWHNAGPLYTEINGDGVAQGNTVSGDEFTIELRAGRFRLYKNAAEITSFGVSVPPPTYPLYFGVIMYTSGAGVSNAKIKINDIGDPPNYAKGGIKVPAIIDWSSGIRKNINTTQQQVGGKGFMGGQTQTTENITYDIDLGLTFTSHGPHNLLREYANADVLIDQTETSLLLSGVYNPSTGADADYDPTLPPDPQDDYVPSLDRQNESIAFDGDGVGTGSVMGGGSGFAIYSGTQTQDPDPTEEAAIDAKYGSGSTTAHRGKARIVHTNFDLSRWGGIVPNMTAAWEHQTLTTLDEIFASLCERVNVKTANGDYDFAGLVTIKPRGMLIAGRLFSPAEIIGSPEIQTVYNYFVTEAEGQIIGFIEGAEPAVTIADTEIGWMDSDADVADILPEVDTIMAPEIGLARQVDVKYIDLDKDWEPNTQSDNRQITEGVSTEVLEVQLALLASEARSAAQRKLYRDYVAGSVHKFTLPWTYLYLYPGYKITITRAEGFSHVMKLTSISGGLGVLDCEGVAIEPAAYTQPAVGSWGSGILPVQSVPAMTILSFLDTPFLRDADEKRDNVGYYVCGTPRTGVGQSWVGFAFYQNRNNNWNLIGSSNLPATIGTVVSATGLNTDDTSIFDRVGVFVVDLYGTSASLSSVTEADILADPQLNQAVCGEMVIQFVTATQVSGFPNRWSLSVLLNGRRGTESHVGDTFTGMRFVLINAAVILVPAMVTDINTSFEYRGVTSGQSLADAATVDFVWTGGTAKPLPPSSLRGERDSDDNLLILWNRRTRIGGWMTPGSEVPLAEEEERYVVEIPDAVPPRSWPVITGMGLAALLESDDPLNKFADITVNTLSITSADTVRARSVQEITQTGNYAEATLGATGDPGAAGFGFIASNGDWTGGSDALFQAAYYVRVGRSGGTDTLKFYVNGVEVYSENAAAYVTTGIRVRITLSGSEVRFTKSWVGPGTPAQYVSAVPPSFPLKVIAQVNTSIGGTYKVEKVVMTIAPQPATIYTAAQMTQDGLVPGGPIRVQVSQISAIVGKGGTAEAILAPFSAATIAGMKLWLKADSLSLSDGAAVATWADQSGLGNDVTQATGSKQPIYKVNILNGEPVVRFDSTDDFLSSAMTQAQPYTLFIVVKVTSTANRYITDGGALNESIFYVPDSTHVGIYAGGGLPTVVTTPTAFHVYGVIFNGATSVISIDGTPTSVNTGAGGLATGFHLMSDGNGAGNPGGDVRQVMLYDSALSTPDFDLVINYLMNDAGL